MKILYITTLAFESNNPANMANMALINGLSSLGCQVDTLSVEIDKETAIYDSTIELNPISNDFRLPLPKAYRYLSSKTKDNNNTYRTKLKNKIKRLMKKVYLNFEIYDGLKSLVDKLDEVKLPSYQYDIIISASDPLSSHLLAERYIERYGLKTIKWVQYWQDPMYMDITRNHFFPKLLKKEENRLLSKADKIVYVSPLTKSVNEKIYSHNSKKMFFVPPGYIKEKNFDIGVKKNKPLLGYYGSYSSVARNILPLYEAASSDLFDLEIIGHGDAMINNSCNVSIFSRKTVKEIEKKESIADILVCICNHSGTQIPSKVYYYAATNKAILIILDGEAKAIRDFLEPYNRFIFCDNNPDDINRVVKEFTNGKYNINYSPVKDFSAESIAKRFIDIAGY